MINIGIIGASGYTGGELLRFLKNHPNVNIVAATSRKFKGKPLYKAHPHLRDLEMEFEDIKVDERCGFGFYNNTTRSFHENSS